LKKQHKLKISFSLLAQVRQNLLNIPYFLTIYIIFINYFKFSQNRTQN